MNFRFAVRVADRGRSMCERIIRVGREASTYLKTADWSSVAILRRSAFAWSATKWRVADMQEPTNEEIANYVGEIAEQLAAMCQQQCPSAAAALLTAATLARETVGAKRDCG